jgi:hypothetical protein
MPATTAKPNLLQLPCLRLRLPRWEGRVTGLQKTLFQREGKVPWAWKTLFQRISSLPTCQKRVFQPLVTRVWAWKTFFQGVGTFPGAQKTLFRPLSSWPWSRKRVFRGVGILPRCWKRVFRRGVTWGTLQTRVFQGRRTFLSLQKTLFSRMGRRGCLRKTLILKGMAAEQRCVRSADTPVRRFGDVRPQKRAGVPALPSKPASPILTPSRLPLVSPFGLRCAQSVSHVATMLGSFVSRSPNLHAHA